MAKTLIVGGVATGASAAARLRRLDETREIIIFEKGDYISFANCGLPYYIGDVITKRGNLLVATSELFNNRFNIEVRTQSEVTAIDSQNKTITVISKEKGTYTETYDDLILAPGATPLIPPIPGINSSRIYTLRNIRDTDAIKAAVSSVQSVTVVGGGYIGIEMAENLVHLGLNVHLVEAAPHILAPFDEDIVALAEREMTAKGVALHLNNGVQSFVETESHIATTLADSTTLHSDVVILAIGVKPDTDFLKDSGIERGARGHILVNSALETSVPHIYAGGDAILVKDFVTGDDVAIPLAGPANKHGRIIADRIAGLDSSYTQTQGSTIIKVFDLALAATGVNERTLKRMGKSYTPIIIHPNHHAGYYPGAMPITLKLLFDEEGTILGAQAVGKEGVDKRMDVIATVMRLGGKVSDLTELELTYAPPFGSAKDVVNFAGYVATNVLKGLSDVIHPRELPALMTDPMIQVIDVRTAGEHARGHIEGALSLSVDELRNHLNELDPDKTYLVHCQVGIRSYTAERILKQNGFKVKNITGGFLGIQMAAPELITQ